jgi:hypothetical protein
MAWRVCPTTGCPNLIEPPARSCDVHQRTTKQRGYDLAHKRLRARWARKVALGIVECWRCHERISSTEPWDLGHDDEDRTQYRGPEHRACNRSTAGR